jgi:acetyltransferase
MKTNPWMEHFFSPEAVALFGSATPGKVGYHLLRSLSEGSFKGRVVCVNPQAQGAFGYPGYGSIHGVPHPVSLAVIAAPRTAVVEILLQCAQKGVASAIVISAGFSEIGNRDEERDLREIGQRHGIRIIGPNCAGIQSTHAGFFPCLEVHALPGHTAFVSQSGALGGAVLGMAAERKFGFSKFISLGNRCDVGEVEILRYLAEDPETEVIAFYIEGLLDGRGFIQMAKEVSRQKPVIVIKSGRTRVGRRAVHSHTGSMTGEDRIYEAAFRQAGLVRVRDIEEMLDLAQGFLTLPEIRGDRVAIVTNSGGPGVLVADRCEELSLRVEEPSDEITKQLRTFLPEIASTKNPIDVTLRKEYEDYCLTLQTVLKTYDAVIAINVATPSVDSVEIARGIIDGSHGFDKPVVTSFMPGNIVQDGIRLISEHGISHFTTGERCAQVLAGMFRYHQLKKEQTSMFGKRAARTSEKPARAMLEPDAMAFLRDFGLPVPEFRVATSPKDAVAFASEIGFPVVLKVISPEILHKSEMGGVKLGIQTPEGVETSFCELKKSAEDKGFRGVTVYPHLSQGLEILIGLVVDQVFGPVLTFGIGGIFTELIGDFSCRIAPITEEEANQMICELRASNILKGTRGLRPRDVRALNSLLIGVSELSLKHPEIMEMDFDGNSRSFNTFPFWDSSIYFWSWVGF